MTLTFDERSEAIDRLHEWGKASIQAVRLQTGFAVGVALATLDPWLGIVVLITTAPAFALNEVLIRRAEWHLRKMRAEVERLRKEASDACE